MLASDMNNRIELCDKILKKFEDILIKEKSKLIVLTENNLFDYLAKKYICSDKQLYRDYKNVSKKIKK